MGDSDKSDIPVVAKFSMWAFRSGANLNMPGLAQKIFVQPGNRLKVVELATDMC